MKILSSFITNSSSTSFVGWIVKLDDVLSVMPNDKKVILFDDILKQSEKDYENYQSTWKKEEIDKMKAILSDDEKVSFVDEFDFIKNEFSIFGIGTRRWFDESYLYLDFHDVISLLPNVQLKDMLAEMDKYLKDNFSGNLEFEYINEAAYDG